jgi:integrase
MPFPQQVERVGILHERVDKNPVEHVETRSQSLYKAVVITPQQTLAILNKLTNSLHYTLVLTCAATALRASEIVSLRWSDYPVDRRANPCIEEMG